MKRSGLITTKIGMTRLYDDAGVAHADLFRKQLDYELVSHESSIYTNSPVFYEPFVQNVSKRGSKHTGKAPKRERKNGGRQKMRKR